MVVIRYRREKMEELYKKRIADRLLANALKNYGAVLIEGPRACGKTTTSLQIASLYVNLQDPKELRELKTSLDTNPMVLLSGAKPMLIDEWQIVPELWNTVAADVQRNWNRHGLYILTGSAALNVDKAGDSAVGAITTIKMWTMSLYESGDSTGEISLSELLANPNNFKSGCVSKMTKEDVIFAICRGGWPAVTNISDRQEQLCYPQDMLRRILDRNLHLEDGSRQNPELTLALLRSYAKNNCKLTRSEKIYKDVENVEMDRTVVDKYIRALKSLFIIEDIDRWSLDSQSRKSIVQTKHIITDPSIAVAALNEDMATLSEDGNAFLRGLLFEGLCIRDIKVYASAHNTKVLYSYYRADETAEVDIVLRDKGGCIALIECKYAKRDIPEAEANLLDLERKIFEEEDKKTARKSDSQIGSRPPILKIVLTASDVTEKRDSGVLVIPLGCLKD